MDVVFGGCGFGGEVSTKMFFTLAIGGDGFVTNG